MIAFFLLGSIVTYSLAVLVYRLHMHSLSKFPGPRLAAVTGLYEIYFTLAEGSFDEEIERLHEQYGPVVRITPDEVHVTSRTSLSEDRWIKGSKALESGRRRSRSNRSFQIRKRSSMLQLEVHQIIRLLQRSHSHRVLTPRFYQSRVHTQDASDLEDGYSTVHRSSTRQNGIRPSTGETRGLVVPEEVYG